MLDFRKKHLFEVGENDLSIAEVASRLKSYGFEIADQSKNRINLIKKGSILDGWKLNPLEWESRIEVTALSPVNYQIYYRVYGVYVNPIVLKNYYQLFFELIMTPHFKGDRIELKKELRSSKIKLIGYHLMITAGILIISLISFAAAHYFEVIVLGYLGILIGATLVPRVLNKQILSSEKTNVAQR